VVGLIAAGTALDARHHQQQSHVDTWLYTFNLRRPIDETAKGRLGIWRTVGRIVAEHPGFGIGPGLIFRVFPGYSQDVPEAPQGIAMSAHNTFLNIAVELGAVGLAVWLALLAVIIVAAWRSAAPRSDPEQESDPWIGLGLLGAWCACLVTMTTGDRTILREDLVLLGVLSALVARRTLTAPPSRSTRLLLTAAAVAVLAAMPFRMRAAGDEVRLDRVTAGLHAPERARDGSMFRWTSGRGVFHVPPSTSVVTLRLRALAPFRQTIRVFVRDAQVAELTPPDGAWVSTRLVLPKPRGHEYHRIELRVSPTWTPPNDGRELGVMLAWEGR
jgi:O-antigen ligase